MNTPPVGGRGNGGKGLVPRREFQSQKDRALQDNVKALSSSRGELENINAMIRDELNLPTSRVRNALGRVLHALVPSKMYSSLPSGLVKFIGEETDVLEYIEKLQRTNVDNTQAALRDLAYAAAEKRRQLDELMADIELAERENWDAQKLQQYMASKADVQIYEEVATLLDKEFSVLPDEEKEKRKLELLAHLKSNVMIGETLMGTMAKVCVAGLQVFHKGVEQYYNYVNFYRPIAVMRDSAKTMVDMNQSMTAGKDALVATFQASLQAIDVALDASKMTQAYSIASPDMAKLLESGQQRLEAKIEALAASQQLEHQKQAEVGKPEVVRDAEVVQPPVPPAS